MGTPLGLKYIYLRWTPHPVIVTIGDNRDHIRVLLYSCYTTITGWGVLLIYTIYLHGPFGIQTAAPDVEQTSGKPWLRTHPAYLWSTRSIIKTRFKQLATVKKFLSPSYEDFRWITSKADPRLIGWRALGFASRVSVSRTRIARVLWLQRTFTSNT